jgi:tetratricopeptide (TPR) repeat protein
MRWFSFISPVLVSCFFLGFVACNNETKDEGYKGFSEKVDSILHDSAQQSVYVDSMRLELLSATNDTDRVHWLNELAATWRGPQGKIMAEEAKRISTENNDLYGIANSESKLALCLARENKYPLADSVLKIAESLALERKFNYILARVYQQKGDIQRFQGNNAGSLPFLKDALKIAQERNYADVIAMSYSSLGDVYQSMHKYDSSKYYLYRVVEIANRMNDKSRAAVAYGVLAVVCRFESDMDSSFYYIRQVLVISKELRDKYRTCTGYSTIGEMYRMQDDDDRALLYFDSARVIAQEIDHKNQLAYVLGSMGSIYRTMGELDKALNYYKVALSISRSVNNRMLIATNLSTIGDVYRRKGDKDTALTYFNEALDIAIFVRDANRQAFIYVDIADIYRDSGLFTEALEQLSHADSIAQNTQYENLKAITWNAMAMTYQAMGNFAQSKHYGELAIESAKASKIPTNILESAKQLYELYDATGDKGRALEMYITYISARDSVENQEEVKRFKQVEYEARESELKAENAQKLAVAAEDNAKSEAELGRNRIILIAVGIGFVIMIILSFVIYRSLRENKKAKATIELQKAIVEEKNKSIHDSITYARRLQEAIIPDELTIKESFDDFFILYLPKDIVAGDFYWYEKTNGHIFLAAADCTGHGVPGAFVSVVCSNALNRAVNEYKLSDPGKILDKTKELVLETFKKSHQNVADGMDISLCAWEAGGSRRNLKWAGAQNSLYVLRGPEIITFQADKQPVGKWDMEKPFTTHTVELQAGDKIILATDGFADQFGGPRGKKIKHTQFMELLMSTSGLSNKEQHDRLLTFFNEWRGDLEQVDDVTVIGLKV